jgi:hypothetical protein
MRAALAKLTAEPGTSVCKQSLAQRGQVPALRVTGCSEGAFPSG